MRITIALIALIALSLAAGPVRAQGPASPPCGDLEGAETAMALFTGYFTGDDPTGVRQSLGIEALPEDYPREIVADPRICGRIFGAAMELLGHTGGAAEKNRAGFDFAIYRFGPYYGLLLDPREAEAKGTHALHRSPLYIFRADGLEYVGGIMQ